MHAEMMLIEFDASKQFINFYLKFTTFIHNTGKINIIYTSINLEIARYQHSGTLET